MWPTSLGGRQCRKRPSAAAGGIGFVDPLPSDLGAGGAVAGAKFTALTPPGRLCCAGSCAGKNCLRCSPVAARRLVGMKACGASHHWARQLAALGHEMRLLPPAHVKLYVKRGRKNDGGGDLRGGDAAADALSAGEERRSPGRAGVEPDPRPTGSPAHHADLRAPQPSGGVRAGRRPRQEQLRQAKGQPRARLASGRRSTARGGTVRASADRGADRRRQASGHADRINRPDT